MKNTTNILLGILAFILIFGIYSLKNINLDLNVSEHRNNTITLTGKSEKDIVPDTAKISFSVNEYNKSQKKAAGTVNEKTKNIIDALEDLDVEKKDIKTKNYSVYPEYDWNNGKRTFRNYRASQSVEVKIRDLNTVSKALAKIVELKVDNLNGPNMFVDNLDDIKDEMREDAIKDAKKKAKELASELGVSLDKIIGFSESNNTRNYYPQARYKTVGASMDFMEESISLPEINPGEEKIIKTVSLTFKIED